MPRLRNSTKYYYGINGKSSDYGIGQTDMKMTTLQINAIAVGSLLGAICIYAMYLEKEMIAVGCLAAIAGLATKWADYKRNGE